MNDFNWKSSYGIGWIVLTIANDISSRVVINMDKVSSFYEAIVEINGAHYTGTCMVMDDGSNFKVKEKLDEIWRALQK